MEGVKRLQIRKNIDDRGFFAELLRSDWNQLLGDDIIVQTSLQLTYPGIIRAWHRHGRGQNDYILVLDGALKICAYDDETGSKSRGQLNEIISTSELLEIVKIPGFYWHGFKCIGNITSKILHFKNVLYNYENPDEERRPWNDPKIIPNMINDNKDDPRVNKSWDWNLPIHR